MLVVDNAVLPIAGCSRHMNGSGQPTILKSHTFHGSCVARLAVVIQRRVLGRVRGGSGSGSEGMCFYCYNLVACHASGSVS